MLDKLPLLAIIVALLVSVLYILSTGQYRLTTNVAGVFVITAVLAAGAIWLIKRNPPRKEP